MKLQHLVESRVPLATDIAGLVRLLEHLSDLRMPLHGCEEAVDIDISPLLGKRDVLLGTQILIAKEDDAVLAQRFAHHGQLVVT